jgi:hypothetical protein
MNERYLAAVHEAGHVVLNTIFDIPVEYAEVTTQEINGIEYVSSHSSNIFHETGIKNMNAIEKEKHAALWLISTAAGIAAEMMAGASDREEQWIADFHQLDILMPKGADINIPIAGAIHFLSDFSGIREAHAIIGEKLFTKGRIESDEIHSIVDSKITREEKNNIKQEIWYYILQQ